MPPRLLLTALAAFAPFAAGCGAPLSSYTLELRHAPAGGPVPAARISADTHEPTHALRASDIVRGLLGARHPDGPPATTDAAGRATLHLVNGQPFNLRILAPGCLPDSTFFDQPPTADTPWIPFAPPSLQPDLAPAFELRLRPSASASASAPPSDPSS